MIYIDGNGEGAVRGRSIDFLGFRFNHDRVLLRKSIKKRFAIKAKRGNRRAIASYKGWCQHCNGAHLFKRMTDMSFKDFGLKPQENMIDGKPFFDIPIRRIGELVNRKMQIIDFIDGVKTKEGDGRVVMKIKDELGYEYKVITSSHKIRDVLVQARELEANGTKVFPQDTEIRCNLFSNGSKEYYLL